MKELQVRIDVISSIGGIKVNNKDEWINPASTSRIKFTSDDKNKEGILFLTNKGYYNDFLDKSLQPNREANIKELNKSISEKFDAKSLDIHRQVALKCAVEFYDKAGTKATTYVLQIAEEFETWLNR